MINALMFERPLRFATRPLGGAEGAREMEGFTYHRPLLVREAVDLPATRAGALVGDATGGRGGHRTDAVRTGGHDLGADQEPQAIKFTAEQPPDHGGRVRRGQAKSRKAAHVLDELGVNGIGGALLDPVLSARQWENAS